MRTQSVLGAVGWPWPAYAGVSQALLEFCLQFDAPAFPDPALVRPEQPGQALSTQPATSRHLQDLISPLLRVDTVLVGYAFPGDGFYFDELLLHVYHRLFPGSYLCGRLGVLSVCFRFLGAIWSLW